MQLGLAETRRDRSVLDAQVLVHGGLLSGDGMDNARERRVQLLVEDDGFTREHVRHFGDHGFQGGVPML